MQKLCSSLLVALGVNCLPAMVLAQSGSSGPVEGEGQVTVYNNLKEHIFIGKEGTGTQHIKPGDSAVITLGNPINKAICVTKDETRDCINNQSDSAGALTLGTIERDSPADGRGGAVNIAGWDLISVSPADGRGGFNTVIRVRLQNVNYTAFNPKAPELAYSVVFGSDDPESQSNELSVSFSKSHGGRDIYDQGISRKSLSRAHCGYANYGELYSDLFCDHTTDTATLHIFTREATTGRQDKKK
ncbi:hypothetical protein GZ77_01445 [Endozoicomonas montiporae]|uniref:Uncharacterized protein n=2 Tax=Endozoicomonas montiporae TaxID=1027273 RepID=A0A081NA73_9GAMM|nr:hypothetical protein [Endozoicomonas montiporae]AMO56973.1 hypothetical protein EZMO1_2933 [Endozoicomonas montiporae CL-33]KEQ15346.1 hypothetical protein GZ77_01445 [Endozoicomonas montiporae]